MDAIRFNELWTMAYCVGFDAANDGIVYDDSRSGEFAIAYLMGYQDGMMSVEDL